MINGPMVKVNHLNLKAAAKIIQLIFRRKKMLKIADIDAILVEREVVDNLDGVLFTNLKLVSITYSYPYQLIMILEIEIAYT